MIVIPAFVTVIYILVLFFTLCWLSALAHQTVWIVTFGLGAAFCGLLLLLGLLRRITAVLARVRFVSTLRRRIRRVSVECQILHTPLRAFFFAYAGADIIITRGGKEYAIKFFPYFIKNYTLHISDKKTAYLSKRTTLLPSTGRFGLSRPVVNEFSFGKRKINLDMEEVMPRILLLSPSCPKVTATVANRRETVDNGYEWQGMTFWYQKSFFKFLEQEGIL